MTAFRIANAVQVDMISKTHGENISCVIDRT